MADETIDHAARNTAAVVDARLDAHESVCGAHYERIERQLNNIENSSKLAHEALRAAITKSSDDAVIQRDKTRTLIEASDRRHVKYWWTAGGAIIAGLIGLLGKAYGIT